MISLPAQSEDKNLLPFSSRPAVRFKNREMTYGEIEARSRRLAQHLVHLGVTPTDRVAIALERSFSVPVAVLAVLKTGAAYVPLDPHYPSERLSFMLRDCQPRVLLTQTSLLDTLSPTAQTTVLLVQEESQELFDVPLPNESQADGPAYIIYTSGSTGEPKGVALGRRALANLIAWQCRKSWAGPDWRTLQFAPLSFDVHFQEFFSTWGSGGALVLIDEETRLDPVKLLATIEQEQVNRLFVPFLVLESLAELGCRRRLFPACLREVISAGEQLQITPALRGFFAQLKGCSLHNHYGPSETHVVTAHQLSEDPAAWPILPPIGEPLPGVDLRVMDEQGDPVGPERPGELYIGGVPLAEGYFNRPALTAERFVSQAGRRFYRTGDVVRRRADGNFEFLGRLDNQVKIRGNRVELGEIEARLREHPAVAQCAVVLRGNFAEDRRLVGYWVANPDPAATARVLREYLHARLPDFMVPSALVRLDALPRTPSGKLDRNALPAPTGSHADWDGEYRAPRNPLEHQLAALWADLLSMERVGVSDNFFELGGDSLLAARLMVRMEEHLGHALPVAASGSSFPRSNRSPRSCGTSLGSRLRPPSFPFSRRGQIPLFSVCPGAEGDASTLLRPGAMFAKLRTASSPQQPFFSFWFNYPTEDEVEPLTIGKVAAGFVRDARSVQPKGPYYLGGWSFGGLVAYEMAQQLRARGEEVELLALVDTTGPGYPRKRPWPEQLRLQFEKIGSLALRERPLYMLKALGALARSKWTTFRGTMGKLLGRSNPWSRVMQLETSYLASLVAYPGPLVLFVATETLAETADQIPVVCDPYLCSRSFVKGAISTHCIQGSHLTMFDEAGLNELAVQLAKYLNQPARESRSQARIEAAGSARPGENRTASGASRGGYSTGPLFQGFFSADAGSVSWTDFSTLRPSSRSLWRRVDRFRPSRSLACAWCP